MSIEKMKAELIHGIYKIKAFFHGMLEFRSSFTANYDQVGCQSEYDFGRSVSHKLTFGKFEQ